MNEQKVSKFVCSLVQGVIKLFTNVRSFVRSKYFEKFDRCEKIRDLQSNFEHSFGTNNSLMIKWKTSKWSRWKIYVLLFLTNENVNKRKVDKNGHSEAG